MIQNKRQNRNILVILRSSKLIFAQKTEAIAHTHTQTHVLHTHVKESIDFVFEFQQQHFDFNVVETMTEREQVSG